MRPLQDVDEVKVLILMLLIKVLFYFVYVPYCHELRRKLCLQDSNSLLLLRVQTIPTQNSPLWVSFDNCDHDKFEIRLLMILDSSLHTERHRTQSFISIS